LMASKSLRANDIIFDSSCESGRMISSSGCSGLKEQVTCQHL
jgi:hypothetical protein